MKKYRYSILFFILFLALVPPFILRLYNPYLEIFPSIIFPSGATLANINENQKIIKIYEFYAKRDSIEKIEKKELFENIPAKYYHSIIGSEMGLKKVEQEIDLPFINQTINRHHYFDKGELEETKKWYREKLNKNNFNDSTLILRRFELKYDIKKRILISKTFLNEKSYDLY